MSTHQMPRGNVLKSCEPIGSTKLFPDQFEPNCICSWIAEQCLLAGCPEAMSSIPVNRSYFYQTSNIPTRITTAYADEYQSLVCSPNLKFHELFQFSRSISVPNLPKLHTNDLNTTFIILPNCYHIHENPWTNLVLPKHFPTKLHSQDTNRQCAELQASAGIFLVFPFWIEPKLHLQLIFEHCLLSTHQSTVSQIAIIFRSIFCFPVPKWTLTAVLVDFWEVFAPRTPIDNVLGCHHLLECLKRSCSKLNPNCFAVDIWALFALWTQTDNALPHSVLNLNCSCSWYLSICCSRTPTNDVPNCNHLPEYFLLSSSKMNPKLQLQLKNRTKQIFEQCLLPGHQPTMCWVAIISRSILSIPIPNWTQTALQLIFKHCLLPKHHLTMCQISRYPIPY